MFKLSVCPHDTAKNLTGWYLFNTYLQTRLDCSIHFEPKESFLEERDCVLSGGYHIVYANPFSAAVFRKSLGFIPVARPIDLFDETVLVSNSDQGIPDKRPLTVASATEKLVVHYLGLSLLEEKGISKDDCEFVFVGNHMKAAQAVIQGKADLAFIYNETWHGMSAITRNSLTFIGETNSQKSFHCFCISPDWSDRKEQVENILCHMQDDPKGKAVLEELRFKGFVPLQQDALEPLIATMDKYGA